MTAFEIAFLITACAIIALHVLSTVLDKKLGVIFTYVNLGLHILFVFVLMALKVSFEFMALSFMTSLLIYLFSAFLCYKIRIRREVRDDV